MPKSSMMRNGTVATDSMYPFSCALGGGIGQFIGKHVSRYSAWRPSSARGSDRAQESSN
jgi:hypothetical protein